MGCFTGLGCWTLKMNPLRSFETSGTIYTSAQFNIPEAFNLISQLSMHPKLF